MATATTSQPFEPDGKTSEPRCDLQPKFGPDRTVLRQSIRWRAGQAAGTRSADENWSATMRPADFTLRRKLGTGLAVCVPLIEGNQVERRWPPGNALAKNIKRRRAGLGTPFAEERIWADRD